MWSSETHGNNEDWFISASDWPVNSPDVRQLNYFMHVLTKDAVEEEGWKLVATLTRDERLVVTNLRDTRANTLKFWFGSAFSVLGNSDYGTVNLV